MGFCGWLVKGWNVPKYSRSICVVRATVAVSLWSLVIHVHTRELLECAMLHAMCVYTS